MVTFMTGQAIITAGSGCFSFERFSFFFAVTLSAFFVGQ